MSTLALDLRAFAERAKLSMDRLNRTAVMLAAQGMVLRSPVDTGRFRANWQFGYGSVNTTTTTSVDTSGGAALGAIKSAVDAVEAGGICYVTNSLPYAQRLENGWSKQAPSGMVKVTFAELPVQLEAYARSLG